MHNISEIFSLTPNVIALSFIGCAVINLFFLGYLIRKRLFNLTVYWFILFILVTILLDVSQAFVSMSNNPPTFLFWLAITDFAIIIPAPLLFSFAITYINKAYLLKKIWIILPIYSAFFILLFLNWTTDFMFSHNLQDVLMTPWGRMPASGPANGLIGLYFLIIDVAYVIPMILFYFKNKDITRKKQTRLLLSGFISSILLTTFLEGILPNILHIPVLHTVIYLELLIGGFTVYALSRYGFGALNIDTTSEKLLQLVPNAIVILDMNNIIKRINASAEKLFQYSQEEVVGKPMQKLFKSEEEYKIFISSIIVSLSKTTVIQVNETQVINAKGELVPVNIEATDIKDVTDGVIEHLLVLTSLQEVKEKSKQLEEKFKEIEKQKIELERMNKVMINRELAMINLKKENEILKNKQLTS